MSVSDPLLRDLKNSLLKIIQNSENGYNTVTDENENLMPLCISIEKILYKGLQIQSMSTFAHFLPEPWDWFNAVAHSMENGTTEQSLTYLRCWESSKDNLRLKSFKGKLRLLIRTCLVNKCLHTPINVLNNSIQSGGRRWYTTNSSILGNEILCEIFLSVIRQCSHPSLVRFQLNLKNTRFLDNSWLLPQIVTIDCVPCDTLGIGLYFVNDLAVVASLEPSGIAAENDNIEVGDVLDELNGTIITSDQRGKLGKLLKGHKRQPVSVSLVKAILDNEIYSPLIPILKAAGVVPRRAVLDNKVSLVPDLVQYLGSSELGPQGDVKQIEKGVTAVQTAPADPKRVTLECEELGLRVIDEERKVLLQHSFMEVSACGQTTRAPKHFAYIVGNDVCNVATNFTCHVFMANSNSLCRSILQNIGQGFERTHFAV